MRFVQTNIQIYRNNRNLLSELLDITTKIINLFISPQKFLHENHFICSTNDFHINSFIAGHTDCNAKSFENYWMVYTYKIAHHTHYVYTKYKFKPFFGILVNYMKITLLFCGHTWPSFGRFVQIEWNKNEQSFNIKPFSMWFTTIENGL